MLGLLAAVYGIVTRFRNLLFDKGFQAVERSTLPVISIGNLTVGGNGKTPLTLWLAQELRSQGRKPVILSRGYGGREAGPHRVSQSDSVERVGDEPLLLASTTDFPVVISRKRIQGARLIEQEQLGDIILLDDGFQHRSLHRDIDILAAYVGTEIAAKEFLEGRLLPWGRFRENREAGLERADIIIFTYRAPQIADTSLDAELVNSLPLKLKVCRSFTELETVVGQNDGKELAPQRVVAFCGLANPEGFFMTLEHSGYELEARETFSDHFMFTEKVIQKLENKYPGLPLVCTQKDAMKIEAAWASKVYVVGVTTKVDSPEILLEALSSHLKKAPTT